MELAEQELSSRRAGRLEGEVSVFASSKVALGVSPPLQRQREGKTGHAAPESSYSLGGYRGEAENVTLVWPL